MVESYSIEHLTTRHLTTRTKTFGNPIHKCDHLLQGNCLKLTGFNDRFNIGWLRQQVISPFWVT